MLDTRRRLACFIVRGSGKDAHDFHDLSSKAMQEKI
jgi:hypothetical protein